MLLDGLTTLQFLSKRDDRFMPAPPAQPLRTISIYGSALSRRDGCASLHFYWKKLKAIRTDNQAIRADSPHR